MNNLLAARRNFDSERDFFSVNKTRISTPFATTRPSVQRRRFGQRGKLWRERIWAFDTSVDRPRLNYGNRSAAARPTTFPQPFFFLALYLGLPKWSRAAAAFAAKSLAALLNPRKTRGGQISLLSLPIYTAPLVKIFLPAA